MDHFAIRSLEREDGTSKWRICVVRICLRQQHLAADQFVFGCQLECFLLAVLDHEHDFFFQQLVIVRCFGFDKLIAAWSQIGDADLSGCIGRQIFLKHVAIRILQFKDCIRKFGSAVFVDFRQYD